MRLLERATVEARAPIKRRVRRRLVRALPKCQVQYQRVANQTACTACLSRLSRLSRLSTLSRLSRLSRLGRRQFITTFRICGRRVKVQRAQQCTAGILDLMLLAMLDQHERAGTDLVPLAVDERSAAAGNDVEPLIGAAMPVLRAALRISGWNDHLSRLRPRVS